MTKLWKKTASIFLCLAVVLSFTPFIGGVTDGAFPQEAYASEGDIVIDTPDGLHFANYNSQGNLYIGDHEVFLRGYDGDATDLVIPPYVEYQGETYTVIGIDEEALICSEEENYAYWLNHDLTSLTLPDTLQYIFSGSIGNLGITELTIPESVTMIEERAINCPNLKTIRVLSSRIVGGMDYYGDCCMGFHYDESDDYVKNDDLAIWGVKTGEDGSGEESAIQRWCCQNGITFNAFTPPTNPRWNGTVAEWDKTAAGEGPRCYRVDVYRTGDEEHPFAGTKYCSSNSVDLGPLMKSCGRGKYAFTVQCYGSADSPRSAEYTYNGAVDTYTLSFDPGMGSGTMDPITALAGEPVSLPACTFTAPSEDKDFYCWYFQGSDGVPGQTAVLFRDETATAQWKDKSDPGSIYSATVDDMTLPTTPVDYKDNPKKVIRIYNDGNRVLRNVKVTLSDDTAGAFLLQQNSVGDTIGPESDNTCWYIEAKPGLAIGNYTAKITVTAQWLPEPITANVSLTIRDHNWSTEWDSDYDNHWHPCTDELCFARKDEAPHDKNVVVGSTDPTFDIDGSTGDKYCSVCGVLRENAKPIPAGKCIRETTATMTPAVITDKYCANDIVITPGDASRYTVAVSRVFDMTDHSLNTGPGSTYPKDKKFIAGHEYYFEIDFDAVSPYVYGKEGDITKSDYWSTFKVNGKEVDIANAVMFGGDPLRKVETTARKGITPKVTLSKTSYTYNGKAQTPAVTVKNGSTTLTKGTDYIVTYSPSGRKDVGKYTVTTTLIGDYHGTGKATYIINPKGTSLKKLRKAKKAVTVKWTKQSAKMSTSRITGYQIQMATDSKFTKNKKTVNVKGYSKTSKKVTGLKGGKKYYVRIRTYKKVGSTTYYSPWSKAKTVTTGK